MTFKLIGYLYPHTREIKSIIVFSIYVTLIFMVVFTMASVLINKVKNVKIDFKKYIKVICVITFSGIAFVENMLINFPTSDGKIYKEYNIFTLISQKGFQKICNYEYFRGLIEIVSFIPIGVLIYVLASRRKVIKAIGYTAIVSVAFEVFANWGSISKYYWPTIINNLLGTVIGVGMVVMCRHIINKCRVNKRLLIISQLPLIITFIAYLGLYLIYFTDVFGSIYPDYYKKLDSNKINVSHSRQIEFIEEWRFPAFVDENEYREYAELLFSLNDASIDESKTRYIKGVHPIEDGNAYECFTNNEEDMVFYYRSGDYHNGIFAFEKKGSGYLDIKYENINYTEEEMRNMLKLCGFDIPLNSNTNKSELQYSFLEINGNECDFRYRIEISDGLYMDGHICIKFDDAGIPYYLYVGLMNKWEISEDNGVLELAFPTIKYRDKTVISPEQAYDKLCEGKCYAKGLVEAVEKGNIDINVKNVRMVMQRDDINCLQYVYCFDIEPIEVEGQAPITKIYVPAMKINY